tara:strand:- start:11649 stop:12416 length:768 start_codon:yes stop_codon:yes gene_type:complete
LTILIAGSGLVGKALLDSLIVSSEEKCYLISLRDSSIDEICKIITTLNADDCFIDSMDPNAISNDICKNHIKKISMIRNFALHYSNKFHYVYLSTASIYPQLKEFIYESIDPLNEFSNEYLTMKIKNELLVKSLSKSTYTIARLVSIWVDENQNSFFGDLIKAHKENQIINFRDGDEKVISYANLNDICKLLNTIILKRVKGIVNVTTDQYNSRANLKAIVNKLETISIKNLPGLRIKSSILRWEDTIDKRSELF